MPSAGFLFTVLRYRTVEELIVVEVDLEEGGALGDAAGDERFGERVFDVALEGATERTRSIAAVDQGLFEDPLLGVTPGNVSLKEFTPGNISLKEFTPGTFL